MLVAILWSLLAPGLPSAASQEVECPSGTTEVLGSCFFLSRGDTLNWDEAESVRGAGLYGDKLRAGSIVEDER